MASDRPRYDLKASFLKSLEAAWAGKGACLVCNGSPTGVSPDLLWKLTMWVDEIIAVDSGLEWLERANITPEIMVGDMDSVDPGLYNRYEVMGVSSIVTSPVKDETDLELGLMCAQDRFHSAVVVANFAGGRLDHELAAIGSMGRFELPVVAVDENCAMVFLEASGAGGMTCGAGGLTSGTGGTAFGDSFGQSDPFGQLVSKPSSAKLSLLGLDYGDEFSVMAYDGPATVSQHGVRYPQEGAELSGLSGRGVSNVVADPDAVVEVLSGRIALMVSY